jgi:hypothetical protein
MRTAGFDSHRLRLTVLNRYRLAIICFLALLLSHSLLQALQGDRQPKYGSDWSRLLQVIVFAERTSLIGDDVTLDILERDSADFPVEFSRILHQGIARSGDALAGLGLPKRIELEDLYTFELTDEVLGSVEPIRRWNQFSELEYFVKVENWTKDSYDLVLRGRVRRNGFKGVKAHLSGDRTTILRISDYDRLYFAFTPMNAVNFATGIARMGDPGVTSPVPVKQAVPAIPDELVNRKVTGRSTSFVVLVGVVEKSGVISAGEYLLAECPHAAFAKAPLNTIFEKWKLRPASKDGNPVDLVVSIELEFQLR